MLQDFSPDNPFRTTHWRWDLAGALADAAVAPSRRRDDRWTARAARLRRGAAACRKPADYYALCNQDPPLYWAHELWRLREQEPHRAKAHALEARFLAGQTAAESGARLGISEATAEAYNRVFFDVLDKLECPDYIMTTVLAPAVSRGLRERDYDLLWKLFGYVGGPLVLDMMMTGFMAPSRPTDAGALTAFVDDAARNGQRRRAMVAAQTMRLTEFNVVPFLAEYNKLVAVERESAGGSGAQQGILSNVKAMIAAIPWRVGGPKATAPPAVAARATAATGLAEFDAGSAELRGDELMELTAGGRPPAVDAMRLLAFPAPPRRRAAGQLQLEVPSCPTP